MAFLGDKKISVTEAGFLSPFVMDKLIKEWGSQCKIFSFSAAGIGIRRCGRTVQEFPHMEDCAKAIRLAVERYENDGPVNIGTGQKTSIMELLSIFCEADSFGIQGSPMVNPEDVPMFQRLRRNLVSGQSWD